MTSVNSLRPVNGRANGPLTNGNDPPPSSILATHLAPVDGNAALVFDDESFSLLLEESLGHDENGQPNLGTEVEINHKLICVLVMGGIEGIISQAENPFRARETGRDAARLLSCLDVIRSALERSPRVLFVNSTTEDLRDGNNDNLPLFVWLIPKILPLLARFDSGSHEITQKVVDIVRAALLADRQCSTPGSACVAISTFFQICTEVLLDQLEQHETPYDSKVVFTLNDGHQSFLQALSKFNIGGAVISSTFPIGNYFEAFHIACKIMECQSSVLSDQPQNNRTASARIASQVLRQFERMWRLLGESLPMYDKLEETTLVLVQGYFQALRRLLTMTSDPFGLLQRQRFNVTWSAALSDFMDIATSSLNKQAYRALDVIIQYSIEISKDYSDFGICLVEIMESQLRKVFNSELSEELSEETKADISTLLQSAARHNSATGADESSISYAVAEEKLSRDGSRARKRLRLSTQEELVDSLAPYEKASHRLTAILTGTATSDLQSLSKNTLAYFRTLNDHDQCSALTVLGDAACATVDNSLDNFARGGNENFSCAICEIDTCLDSASNSMHAAFDPDDELIQTLLTLLPVVSRSPKARIIGLLSLRKILKHTASFENLQLSQSTTGDLVLQSLRSSSRDVRITATQLLDPFVTKSTLLDSDLVHQNRVTALDLLQHLWAKEEVPLQETVILALTCMAKVVEDEELNIILIRLIEYLGHGNAYISGLVYSELQRLAQNLQVTMATLIRPFWRTIGVVVIKHLSTRPMIAQQLCDLLGMQVDGLLMLIEEYAIPYLVLNKRQDVIQRIAMAHGSSTTPFHLCTNRQHLAAILSFLLAQSFPDPEQNTMSLLLNVSRDFSEQDLSGWISHEPILIGCELLKLIVDAGEGRGSRIHQALQLLAQLMSRKSSQSSTSRKTDFIGTFLENNALALVTQFTVVLSEIETVRPNVEKRRCLAAIGQILKLGKSRVASALPQICACLRSALESKDLCNAAFDSWTIMLTSLKEEDIEPLVDQTLAIIVRSWDIFNSSTQQQAYGVVADLLGKHTALIRDIFNTMPSLSTIPLMSKFESEIGTLKRQMDERHQFMAFIKRLQNENVVVVEQALRELLTLLREKPDFVHRSLLREQPDLLLAELTRNVLDCSVKYNNKANIALLCGKSLGLIGCLDPNKIESIREKKSIVVLSNFSKADETVDFIIFFLEHVLVPSFLSASSTRGQGFLAWSMQELLKACDFDSNVALRSRTSSSGGSTCRRWLDLPEAVRNTLTPFLSSRYLVQETRVSERVQYPLFQAGIISHSAWLRTITLDLLHKGSGDNVQLIFEICCRLIHGQNHSIPMFLLPFAALNLVLNGVVEEQKQLVAEMLSILEQPMAGDHQVQEDVRLCSEAVFEVLDYMTKWLHQRRKQYSANLARTERGPTDLTVENAQARIKAVEQFLDAIPPEVISQRAIECKSFARALFHWEQYIRNSQVDEDETDAQLERLQEIYAQIDEPDGIEGISSQLHVLNIEQQILEHRKAGRWTAAQSWYELQLTEHPKDPDIQMNLMQCLKESGQHDVLLHHFDGLDTSLSLAQVLPYAVEASWVSGRWDKLPVYIEKSTSRSGNFNIGVARILQSIRNKDKELTQGLINELYQATAAAMSVNSVASLQASHDTLLKLHVLTDLQLLTEVEEEEKSNLLGSLSNRLEVLGSYVGDKQYLLGIRRAVMQLLPKFSRKDVATEWLASARLARKADSTTQAFNAILHASALGEKSATIEQAKLTWMEGHHRKAIQTLEGAIESKAFVSYNSIPENGPITLTKEQEQHQNEVAAKAYVLLGKWLDAAGQTQSEVIVKTFREATDHHRKWEKGFYHLGKYYNKILDSERSKPPGRESQAYLTGEAAKVVIDNYLRSLISGNKYVFQTLPKALTLWLELVSNNDQPQDARRGNEKFHAHNAAQKMRVIEDTHAQMKKYADRLLPVILYTIFPGIVARICNPNPIVYGILITMVIRVVRAYPQQSLWTLLAVVKSQSRDRASRGLTIITKVVESTKKSGKDTVAAELRSMIAAGQKFSDELLRISDYNIEGKITRVSLTRDLGFNHKIAPSRLVVPVESCLIPSLPVSYEPTQLKSFRAFPKDATTITAFLDDALVLSSLQKPRKLSIRGSDGKIYGVLAKPKDDMRKDQRLMEFNTLINRFLKRDVEASKRRLYIRTYAVVPLNEECGLIEWVDNLKTFRDILLKLYKEKNIAPNYSEIRNLLDQACLGGPQTVHLFNERVLTKFPAVFHDWFVDTFPDPSTWFNARLRYTRSAAVMSIVGHVLGLGDRHGENILFEEDNGGTLHVDFNCLFDKGLTFEKPEMVPFRLTHNLIDAMGTYSYNGPFRRCCEITLTLLRGNEDALMTILETFLHDPTTDFINAGKRKKPVAGVPDTPVGVLDGVRGKVKGLLPGESVPLSVGGYVEELIKQATNPENLCRMYIGWCSFF